MASCRVYCFVISLSVELFMILDVFYGMCVGCLKYGNWKMEREKGFEVSNDIRQYCIIVDSNVDCELVSRQIVFHLLATSDHHYGSVRASVPLHRVVKKPLYSHKLGILRKELYRERWCMMIVCFLRMMHELIKWMKKVLSLLYNEKDVVYCSSHKATHSCPNT